MAGINDLRKIADDDFEEIEEEQELPIDFDAYEEEVRGPKKRFLGMTAGERALLSLFLFMNVTVLGLAILAVTGRLRF